jgi:uncharacterized membrane protein YccF (DUF307 family)
MSLKSLKASQDILCTTCDTPNQADATFCTACGSQLHQAAPSPQRAPLAPAVQIPTSTQHSVPYAECRVCHIPNPNEARYCVNCGNPMHGPIEPARRQAYAPMPIAPSAPNAFQATNITYATTNVYNVAGAMPATPQPMYPKVPFLARAAWFVMVGCWLSQLWLMGAWLCSLTVIGLPLSLWMTNRMPHVMTLSADPLKQPESTGFTPNNVHFAVRVVYFVMIGWWLSLLWMQLAWLVGLTVIGLPVANMMFEQVGLITTLDSTKA